MNIFKMAIGFMGAALCFFAHGQSTPTSVVLDDWAGDMELLRSIYSKAQPTIDVDYFIKTSKRRDFAASLGNAFAYKREVERLMPAAESRRAELKAATFVVIAGLVGPNIDSYDFNTKSFKVDFGPTIR